MNVNRVIRVAVIVLALGLTRWYLRSQRQSRAPTQENVQRAEQLVRSLATDSGCASAGDCASAPAGLRACGGPRFYVVYCPRLTDTARLTQALRDLRQRDSAYNVANNLVGTCEMKQPPTVALAGRVCRATSP